MITTSFSGGDNIENHRHGESPWPVEEQVVTVASHPLGIKPSSNAYMAQKNIRTAIGKLYSLPDDLIVQVLELLDASSLIDIGITCKFFFAFSRLEEIWKNLCIASVPSVISWRGTWRSTYLKVPMNTLPVILDCGGLYSDVLHRPFLCAQISLLPYCSNIPTRNEIARFPSLSQEDFTNHWTDTPFILTMPVQEWPVYKTWSTETMLQKYGDIKFQAESVQWPLKTYVDYMKENQDESPLYLFDRSFVEKMGLPVGKGHSGQYWPPSCFGEDLFSVLEHQRPDSRWLILGPERSGSTFHKDPNATSAWNAVLRGSKYWIMFPTHVNSPPPPGVFVSDDQSEVTSPLSIAEWLLGFHAQARKTSGCKEGICHEGEVLHVPSGWWHLVVNIEASIAITQNFVPEKHLPDVLEFLKNQPQSISGFGDDLTDAYGLFVEKMREKHPEMLDQGMQGLERLQRGGKRKWEQLVSGEVNDKAARSEGFSFGFSVEDDEDIE